MKILQFAFCLLISLNAASAALTVKIDEPKRTGTKAIIKLMMKNTFAEKIESARAVLFLIDDQGKVVGQSIQWVIGGKKYHPVLAPDASTTFNFVVSTDKPFTKTKLTFSRIILDGGKLADTQKDVEFVAK
jgi:hypothetical protein